MTNNPCTRRQFLRGASLAAAAVPTLLLIGLTAAAGVVGPPLDPLYQGKRLSQWFEEYSVAPAYLTPATKAIQVLGTNAVPYLVQFLAPAQTNAWRKRAAISALDDLGTNASASLPSLVRCLDDGDAKVQADAAYTLPKLGLVAKATIPRLQVYLKEHDDAYNGLAAAVALWRLDPRQASVVVPALTRMLMLEGHFEFDAHVIDLLAEIGPPAKQAIPALRRGLQTYPEDRDRIRDAIAKIRR